LQSLPGSTASRRPKRTNPSANPSWPFLAARRKHSGPYRGLRPSTCLRLREARFAKHLRDAEHTAYKVDTEAIGRQGQTGVRGEGEGKGREESRTQGTKRNPSKRQQHNRQLQSRRLCGASHIGSAFCCPACPFSRPHSHSRRRSGRTLAAHPNGQTAPLLGSRALGATISGVKQRFSRIECLRSFLNRVSELLDTKIAVGFSILQSVISLCRPGLQYSST